MLLLDGGGVSDGGWWFYDNDIFNRCFKIAPLDSTKRSSDSTFELCFSRLTVPLDRMGDETRQRLTLTYMT